MADHEEETVERVSALPRKVWMTLLGACALFIAIPFVFIALRYDQDPDPPPPPDHPPQIAGDTSNNSQGGGGGEPSAVRISSAAEQAELQRSALMQAKLKRVRGQGVRLRRMNEELSKVAEGFYQTLRKTLSDQAGRRIAGSGELVDQYDALQQQHRPTSDVVQQLAAEVDDLLVLLEAPETTEVQDEFAQRLNELEAEIRQRQQQFSSDSRSLESLIAQAKSEEPAAKLLSEALEARRQRHAHNRLQQIEAKQEQVRTENTQRLVEAEAALQQAKDEQKISQLQSQLNDQKQSKAEAERLAELERDYRRDEAEIKRLLQPFISSGMTQPGRTGFRPDAEVGPVSLARLQGSGALKPTVEGRKALYYITGNGTNDRDLGAFPRYVGGAQDVQARQPVMKRVQDLINKYGELMVQKELLAP